MFFAKLLSKSLPRRLLEVFLLQKTAKHVFCRRYDLIKSCGAFSLFDSLAYNAPSFCPTHLPCLARTTACCLLYRHSTTTEESTQTREVKLDYEAEKRRWSVPAGYLVARCCDGALPPAWCRRERVVPKWLLVLVLVPLCWQTVTT